MRFSEREHDVLDPDAQAGSSTSRQGGAVPDDEAFLRLAQSTARIGLWSWDLATDTVWYSAELYRVHGATPGALGERPVDYLAFVHPDDQARVAAGAALAATGDTIPLEFRFIHPEGGVRHLIAHSALVRDGAGNAHRLVGTVQDITATMRARESVSEAFTRLSAYFEEMPTPAYLWRKEGDELVLRRFNKAAKARWGDRAADLTGALARELCAERPDIVADIEGCMFTQQAITRETDYTTPEMGTRRLVITFVPVARDAVVAHADDISDLLAVSRREERADAQLAEYFQRVPTPAYLWRAKDGEIVLEDANRAGLNQTRGIAADYVGITARALYADRPDILHDFERAVAGETFTREYPYRLGASRDDKDLVVTYVHLPPDMVVAHTRDVTEQRRMEEEVRESHEYARGVMEGNPDGICLITGGVIRACNASFSRIMGCPKKALVGRALHDLMVSQDRERAMSRGKAILRGEPSEPNEFTIVRGDGTSVPVEIFAAAFSVRGEPALVCTLRDVGKRKEAERELAESRDALRALTQHLESVREQERVQVARDLHDELGSVLTALKLDLNEVMSAESGQADPELLEAMSGLLDQAIEVGRRVTSRLRPGILDDLGLAAAAEWVGQDLEKRTGVRCRVVLPEVEPELPEPIATAMFRILQEALTNVIRHSEADEVEVALEYDADSISLTVADNGRGFDLGAGGNGGFGYLGMRERVRAFAGAFDVETAPGQGTWIRVTLPTP